MHVAAFRAGRASLRAPLAMLVPLLLAALLALVAAPSARADAFGELARFGGFGSDPGQTQLGMSLGVDPRDDSLYVTDYNAAFDRIRLQKLSADGRLLASAELPGTPMQEVYLGFALDTALDRLYLVEFDYASGLARRLLVYSTVPDGSRRLVAPAGLPSGELSFPARSIWEPTGIAVDLRTHDVVVVGSDLDDPSRRKLAVQRIGSGGAAGPRFVDAAQELMLPGTGGYPPPASVVVAADGTVYVQRSEERLSALYRLPPSLGSIERIDLTEARRRERWAFSAAPFVYMGDQAPGAQLAIGPDDTLYWAEELVPSVNGGQAGNYIVRGFSLETMSTVALYGGSRGSTCRIEAANPALAADGGDGIFVLDHADLGALAFGERLIHFGPGGSGCPVPVAQLAVNSRTERAVTVTKGADVTLDASASELHGATVADVAWDLDGSGAFATSTGTDLVLRRRFTRSQTFTLALRVRLSNALYGDPEIVTRTVTVVSPTPTASFTVSNRTPGAGGTVTFDASRSVDPAGTADARPTNVLKEYTWDFGDGSTQTTRAPTIAHVFENATPSAIARTVRLTVTSNDDVRSGPVSQTVTVGGTPLPPPPPPPPPAPAPAAPGTATVSFLARGSTASAAKLVVRCAAGPICTGDLALTATLRARRGRRVVTRRVAIGRVAFSVAGGASATVTVRLSAAARAVLAKAFKLRVGAALVTRNAAGLTSTSSKALTLTAPKPRRRAARR